MKIYNLLHDAENYKWLEYQGEWFDFFHNIICNNQKIEYFNYDIKCKTIRDKKERILGDYPCFTVPVLSKTAKDLLEPYISNYVQMFPLNTGKLGKYYFLNIINVLDCLDKEKSVIQYLPSSEVIYKINQWYFNKVLTIENSRFFIIQNQIGERIYINEEIKNMIEEHQLKGFIFKEVGKI